MRNYKELESILEELSALYSKNVLQQIYEIAKDPQSFLYIKLTEHHKRDMFYKKFNSQNNC